MIKDKFDQFFIKQMEAKNLQKNGRKLEALELYLKIIDDYKPFEDHSYKQAIILLEEFERFNEARLLCKDAMERINLDKLQGDVNFYRNHIGIIDTAQKESKSKKPIKKSRKNDLDDGEELESNEKLKLSNIKISPKLLLFIFYLMFSISLSIPMKIAKFIFLMAIYGIVYFSYDFINKLLQKIFDFLPLIIMFLSLSVSMLSSTFITTPEWTHFFNVSYYPTKTSSAETIKKPSSTTSKPSANQPTGDQSVTTATTETTVVNADNLESLNAMMKNNLVIKNYKLVVIDKKMELSVFLFPSVKESEAKDAITKLLIELNNISGNKEPELEGLLGKLYEGYRVHIDVYDSFGTLIFLGEVKQNETFIRW